ncbi:MAG: hypothetical protein JRF27_08585 [Deltaproteobacteria bacterium]|nr:hypothetical protein [Deltaproteobacteria bacterium]MBW2193826.1 hypothetical protein [Deltaproteobacteria bacterium]
MPFIVYTTRTSEVNYHSRSGWLEFTAIGRKGKKHARAFNVELATRCKTPEQSTRFVGKKSRRLYDRK